MIGEDDNKKYYRLRCLSCTSIISFPAERVLRLGRVLTEAELLERREALSAVKEYDPLARHWRGQAIWHPVLDDVGEIIEKRETSGAHHVIIDDFEKHGKKQLIEQSAMGLQS